jgi:hypothetical protein
MEVVLEGKSIAQLDFSSHNNKTASRAERTAVESIEMLNASRNHINSILRLTVFRNLVILNLSHNRLTSPIETWLRELPRSIRELCLSHNEISDLLPTSRGKSHRETKSSILNAFCSGPTSFPLLEVLDLSGNLLSEPFHAAAEDDEADDDLNQSSISCPLAVVNLSDNSNLCSVNSMLKGLRRLRKAFLDGNRISNLEGLLALAACPVLEQVTIRGCDIESQLQDPEFLEKRFAVERHEVRTSGIGQLFVACFVGQVLPRVLVVNDVETVAANEIILPILQIARDCQEDASIQVEHAELEPQAAGKLNQSKDSNSCSAHQGIFVQRESSAQSSFERSRVAPLLAKRAKVHDQLFADTSVSSQPPGSATSSSSFSAARDSCQKLTGDVSFSATNTDEQGRAHAAVMNSLLSKGALSGRSMSHQDERRIVSLEKRCADLEMFLVESSRSSRRLTVANDEAAATLHQKRQLVSMQLKELAALKLERDKAEADAEQLQHAVQKRTRELDHAEQSNIRMVEKRLVSLVEESKLKEESRRKKVLSPQQNRSRSPPPPSAAPLTTSNLLQMEATNKRLAALRATSPTAAVGSKFRYDEFGSLTTTGDVELFPPAKLPTRRQSTGPEASTSTINHYHADPTINVSEVSRTQHVSSPSRVFSAPPPFATVSTATVGTSPLRSTDSSPGRKQLSAAGSPVAESPLAKGPEPRVGSLDVAFMDAALHQEKGNAREPTAESPGIGAGNARRLSGILGDISPRSSAGLDSFVFPAADPQIFVRHEPPPADDGNSPYLFPGESQAMGARKSSLRSGRLTSNEPQNTSYTTATTSTASDGEGTPAKSQFSRQSIPFNASVRSPPPYSSGEQFATPPVTSRQSLSIEKRASIIGLADAPAAVSSTVSQPTGQGSFVEVSPPSPNVTNSSPARALVSTIMLSSSPSLSQVMLPVELSSIIERNNDAIRRLSIEQGLGTPGRLRGPPQLGSFDRRPSAAEIMNMSSDSQLSAGASSAPPRRMSMEPGVATVTAPGHVYNYTNSTARAPSGDALSRASLTDSAQVSVDTSPLSRQRPSVR